MDCHPLSLVRLLHTLVVVAVPQLVWVVQAAVDLRELVHQPVRQTEAVVAVLDRHMTHRMREQPVDRVSLSSATQQTQSWQRAALSPQVVVTRSIPSLLRARSRFKIISHRRLAHQVLHHSL